MLNTLIANLEEARKKGADYLATTIQDNEQAKRKPKQSQINTLDVFHRKMLQAEKAIQDYGKGIIYEVKGSYWLRKNIASTFTEYYVNVLESEIETLINTDIKNCIEYTSKKITSRKPILR